MNRNIKCQDFYEIKLINRKGDTTIPKSIVLKDRDLFNEFCKELKTSNEIGRPNIKDQSGFYEILIGFKDGSRLTVLIIFTHYDGIVVMSRMRYFRNTKFVELTERVFNSYREQKAQ